MNCRDLLQLHHVHGRLFCRAHCGSFELSPSDCGYPRDAPMALYSKYFFPEGWEQIKSVFLQWLPWILGMSRPGKKITRKTILMSNRMKELELKERSSKSLLANVLDIDDDFRHCSGTNSTATSAGFLRGRGGAATLEDTGSTPCSVAQRELQAILRELQFITGRMRKADDEAELISDWKFAAMVVDRFCLIIFTMFTIIATVAVLLSAPHIIVQ
ncbi:hypothetical protein C0J52_06519 [Blattella germanica]|nr:hypothetical protein C0J52_06519 [Blattella germanica]